MAQKGIRVIFPELTSERREQLLKLMNDKREDARVSLRGARDETWSEIQKKGKKKRKSERTTSFVSKKKWKR